MKPRPPARAARPMPRGIHNVYLFEVFNTASWNVVLAAPMLLFFQQLNASATVMAIAGSLAPLLNCLQIPAAQFVEQVGYRRYVLGGWTTRSFMIVGMTGIALLPAPFDRSTRISGMLFLLFIYNTLRGISVCGLLPWFTHIVPEERRGEFLARDQIAGAFATIVSLCFFGLLLGDRAHPGSFAIVFALSAVSAFISLMFLRRVPDVAVEQIVRNPHPLPWREMFFYPPFFHYMRFNLIFNFALGASNIFWVRFFRGFLHVSQANILFSAAISNVVLAGSLLLITPLIDQTGNKPVLTCSGIFLGLHYLGWALIAGGLLPFNLWTFLLQTVTSGIGGALWNLGNVRAVMGIVPSMGRAHFLALYSVASSLTLGLAPLLWGPILDLLQTWRVGWGWWHWNNFSLLYATLAATILVGLGALRTMEEPQTMPWDAFLRELLVKTPSRAISRLIGRLRAPGLS